MKFCNICKNYKDENEFSFRNKSKGIRSSNCKSCQKITKDKHYKENKDYYLQKSRRIKKKNMVAWKEFKKTLSCVKCGENHPAALDFHHLDESTKNREISRLSQLTLYNKKCQDELAKCIVLCSN